MVDRLGIVMPRDAPRNMSGSLAERSGTLQRAKAIQEIRGLWLFAKDDDLRGLDYSCLVPGWDGGRMLHCDGLPKPALIFLAVVTFQFEFQSIVIHRVEFSRNIYPPKRRGLANGAL
jgi:hypothetical protein